MKKTYKVFSSKYDCYLSFTYLNGLLCGFQFENESEIRLDVDSLVGILEASLTFENLTHFAKSRKMAVVEVQADLSFEAFWNAYNYKDGGSKKKAQAIWGRLSETNKAAAMASLPKYEQFLKRSQTAKAFATTYLNQERWNNQ